MNIACVHGVYWVAMKDKIWMTATRERVRIKAIARDGRSAIVITSKGTPMGGGKTATYKGHTIIHNTLIYNLNKSLAQYQNFIILIYFQILILEIT